MRWPDEWGAASSDYDIALLRGDTVVASGSDFQDGEGDPYEVFDFEAPDDGDYDLVVRQFEAEPAEQIQILIYAGAGLQMEHRVAAGTLPSPADSANPGMVSVGAVDVQKPDMIETYSSRGPTVDGRMKPDLVAGDCMATVTFGLFCGTSAAAPLTTGAAALDARGRPDDGPDRAGRAPALDRAAAGRPVAEQHVRRGPAAPGRRRCPGRRDRRPSSCEPPRPRSPGRPRSS